MLQCSDIEEMARTGANPASQEERLACLSHLASCQRCRGLLLASGLEIATLADESSGASPGTLSRGLSTIAGEPGNTVMPDQVSLVSLSHEVNPSASIEPSRMTTGLDPTMCDLGPDPYSTIPTGQRRVRPARNGKEARAVDEGDGARTLAGLDHPNDSPDPSWPKVPGHELLSRLGEGGMGVVYKARQVRLNRLVALKMIRGEGQAGEVRLNRFRIEAEAVARVRHPNIVQIYEIGDVDGLPYFSLEFLEGGGLDAKLAGTPRPGREAATMLAALCSAIEAAHQAQIIHRDLKPSNVVLAADGTPKVTDFGLAKRLEEQESQERTGDVMGSPSYMSPEQAKGEVHLVGPASDIYSLGAILYEMLTGRPPFRGTSAWDTVRQVVEEEPVPPSKLQSRVPRDLETIALKCLQKDPARRYATARAMGDDIRRYLSGEPILARPIPFWERGLKLARRRPAMVSLVAVSAAMLVGLAGASIWYALLLQDRKRAEVDRITDLVIHGQRTLSEGRKKRFVKDLGAAKLLLTQLDKTLSEEPSSKRPDSRTSGIHKLVVEELEEVEEASRLADRDRELEERLASFRVDLGRFKGLRDEARFLDTWFDGLQQVGRDRNAEALGRKAREGLGIFTRVGDGGPRSLAPMPREATKDERAEVLDGAYELILILAEAEARRPPGPDPKARAKEALRVLDSAPGLAPDLAETRAYHLRRSAYLHELGAEAEAALEREKAKSPPRNAFDHFLSGLEAYKQGRIDEAIPDFEAARVRDRKLFWARALLAISYVRSGRPAEARIVLDECLGDRKDFAWLYILRGYASGEVGRASGRGVPLDRPDAATPFDGDQARSQVPRDTSASAAHFKQAEENFLQALGLLKDGDKELRYTLYLDRGMVRYWDSRFAEAVADFEEAIRVDPLRPNAYVNLARVRYHQDDLDGAIGQLSEAIARNADRASTVNALQFRALVHGRKADKAGDRAIRARERQLALDDYAAIRLDPEDRPAAVASVLVGRARLLLQVRRSGEALQALADAIAAHPFARGAHQLRGEALLDGARYDEAIASCDAGIAGGGSSADLYAIRGKAQFKKENFAEAIRDLDRSLDRRPTQPELLILRGNARFYLGLQEGLPSWNPRLALDDFENASRLDPANAAAYSGRGNVLSELDQPELAMVDADRSLRLDSGSPLNLLRCARIYARAADAEIAQARSGKVASVSPREYRDKAVNLLGRAIRANSRANRRSFDLDKVRQDPGFRMVRRDPRIVALLREPGPAGTEKSPRSP
jgi:eukaryotic-like serine/threonine-protein kinase